MSHSATLHTARAALTRRSASQQHWPYTPSSQAQRVNCCSYRRHSSCACQQLSTSTCRSRQRGSDSACTLTALQFLSRWSAAVPTRPPVSPSPRPAPWLSSRRSLHTARPAFAPSTAQASAASSPPPPASPSPSSVSSTHPPLAPPGQSVPIPSSHLLLFQQGALPSPDAIVSPTPRVVDVFRELQSLSQYEMLQLQNVLTLSYGVQPTSRSFGMGATGAFGRQPAGGQPAGAAGSAAAAPQAAAEEKKEEKPAQTVFAVRLDSFAAADKIKVIKEVRAATGLGLKESKELVEAAPKTVKGGLSKADCDALVAKLKEVGAKVTVE